MVRPPRLTLLSPADTLRVALERLQRAGVDGLPVVTDGKLVGVLTRRGAAAFLQSRTESADARQEGAPSDGSPEGEGPAT